MAIAELTWLLLNDVAVAEFNVTFGAEAVCCFTLLFERTYLQEFVVVCCCYERKLLLFTAAVICCCEIRLRAYWLPDDAVLARIHWCFSAVAL